MLDIEENYASASEKYPECSFIDLKSFSSKMLS